MSVYVYVPRIQAGICYIVTERWCLWHAGFVPVIPFWDVCMTGWFSARGQRWCSTLTILQVSVRAVAFPGRGSNHSLQHSKSRHTYDCDS